MHQSVQTWTLFLNLEIKTESNYKYIKCNANVMNFIGVPDWSSIVLYNTLMPLIKVIQLLQVS